MDAALLDTDTLSEVLRQRNPVVVQNAADYLKQQGQFSLWDFSRCEVVRGTVIAGFPRVQR